MQIKTKSFIKKFLVALSVSLNILFFSLISLALNSKTSTFSFYSPDNYTTAAAVISIPKGKGQSAAVELMSLNLKPGDKAFIQFSVISGQNKQANLLFTPLFDPNVISVSNTGFGLEITAVREGNTLMQTLTNDGIKNIANITVSNEKLN